MAMLQEEKPAVSRLIVINSDAGHPSRGQQIKAVFMLAGIRRQRVRIIAQLVDKFVVVAVVAGPAEVDILSLIHI